jgi:hypothetical protein
MLQFTGLFYMSCFGTGSTQPREDNGGKGKGKDIPITGRGGP